MLMPIEPGQEATPPVIVWELVGNYHTLAIRNATVVGVDAAGTSSGWFGGRDRHDGAPESERPAGRFSRREFWGRHGAGSSPATSRYRDATAGEPGATFTVIDRAFCPHHPRPSFVGGVKSRERADLALALD